MKLQESQDKKKPKFQIQLEKEELDIWKNFAKLYHRGNLSRMIRTLVNRSILETDLEELEGSSSKLDRVVKSILQDSQRSPDKVDSLESDLTVIKNLLSRLLQTQSNVIMKYQTSISVPLEDMVNQQVYEYVESK
ncbi:MAG: hypothetical protein IH840_13400 [Candidatus Heimdallarchaeota archaeon]|nr:hypothetical protein [Candidatus Heimdallarchaeota archaeon]